MPRLSLPAATAPGTPHRRTLRPRIQTHAPRRRPTPPRLVPEADASLFELFHDAVVGTDLHTGQIVLWNPAAEQIFGYSAAQAVGQHVDILMPPAIARL